ncbi:MAG: hypothetical protein DYG89_01895 [Caldilinea sp. CFX5]|nr:hypothetical protein [Caldilinea sp. CFX5]
MPQTFAPHPIYRWLTLGGLLLTGLLGWDLFNIITPEEFFFFLLSVTITLWFGNTLFSQVRLDERTIALQTPLRGVQQLDLRQVVSATEAGRLQRSLALLYHPRQPDGLLDLDQIQSLRLPMVVDQENLLAAIEARILK